MMPKMTTIIHQSGSVPTEESRYGSPVRVLANTGIFARATPRRMVCSSSGNWDEEVYIRDGHFDQNRMLALVPAVLEDAKQRGFRLPRLVTHMERALEDRPGVNDLVEFEAKLNLLPRFRDPVVCVYDLAEFGADVVIDVMGTHPMIMGGILQEKPFFVHPDEFLRELRERGSGANVTLTREN